MTVRALAHFFSLALCFWLSSCSQSDPKTPSIKDFPITTNEGLIKGLFNHLDVSDPKVVFQNVFNGLPDTVTVYPSEGYYYVSFFAQGQMYIGSFALLANKRDSGIAYFGYSQKIDRNRQDSHDAPGGSLELSLKNGVDVSFRNDTYCYEIGFENKRVVFSLYHPEFSSPRKAKLLPSEEFVGPTLDESGVHFYLVYDRLGKHFLWLLNEDLYVPERFTNYGTEIVIGLRTGFAFYQDSIHHRKILIGVFGWNVFKNNWYAGPFDHLPDNYIYDGKINLKEFIEDKSPELTGSIDKYGNYINEPGNRVAIAPYRIYYFDTEFNFLEACSQGSSSRSEFYRCITQPDHIHDPSNE